MSQVALFDALVAPPPSQPSPRARAVKTAAAGFRLVAQDGPIAELQHGASQVFVCSKCWLLDRYVGYAPEFVRADVRRKHAGCLGMVRAVEPKVALPDELAEAREEAVSALASALSWSPQQEAIFEAVVCGSDHIAVVARAGTGKTTTIVEAVKRLPADKRVLVLAFNKEIQQELQRRLPGREVYTTHGLGMRAITAAFQEARLAKDKLSRLLTGPVFSTQLFTSKDRSAARRVVAFAKTVLAESAEQIAALLPRCDVVLGKLDNPALRSSENFIALVQKALERCKESSSFDFDDMIWFPHVHDLAVGQWDVVVVDEAQDLSRAQIEMFSRALAPGGRLVAVGDPRQAIYAFRGAHPGAFDALVERYGARVLKLTRTYRCGQAIVALARTRVPDFEAAPTNAPGEVVEAKSIDVAKLEPGDFVVSRKNAPLLSLCFRAVAAGVRARVVGRDFGKMLEQDLQQAERSTPPGARAAEVQAELLRTLDGAIEQRAEQDLDCQDLHDKRECWQVLFSGCGSVEGVRERLRTVFGEDEELGGYVDLMSTHKAKGLEAERVWMLESTYQPHRSLEEENLWYVAVTRAKRTLVRVVGAP